MSSMHPAGGIHVHPHASVADVEMSQTDSPRIGQMLAEINQKQREKEQQQQAAAAAAAAAAHAHASSHAHASGVPIGASSRTGLVGCDADAGTKPWSTVDQFASQQTIMHLFYESLDRIRKANNTKATRVTQPQLDQTELLLLHSLFGKDLAKALKILDDRSAIDTIVGDSSKRVYWRVKGSSAGSYYITTQFHCTCMAFVNQVIVANTHLYCKHQLAALIGDAIHVSEPYSMKDVELGNTLMKAEAQAASTGYGGYRRQH